MTEYPTTSQDAAEMPGAIAGADTIDVLIRHLEAAKRTFSSSGESTRSQDGGELSLTFPDTICTLLYAVPGTFCPLLYLHAPSVAESVTEST
jgi:hypothetical protein